MDAPLTLWHLLILIALGLGYTLLLLHCLEWVVNLLEALRKDLGVIQEQLPLIYGKIDALKKGEHHD